MISFGVWTDLEKWMIFEQRLGRFIDAIDAVPHTIARAFGERAVAIARDEIIGNYQPANGAYPAWPPLAEATKRDRVKRGFSADEPLEVTQVLHDAVAASNPMQTGVDEVTIIIGYKVIGGGKQYPAVQEIGTDDGHVPPRPVIGPAVMMAADEVLGVVEPVMIRHFNILNGTAGPAPLDVWARVGMRNTEGRD